MSWPMVKLGEVAAIEMGQAPAGDTYNDQGDGYPLIAGASDLGELYPQPTRYTTAAAKISAPGDIVMCIRATIGDLNIADKRYCLGRGVCGLRPKADAIDVRYLWNALQILAPVLRSKGRGATFLQVSKSDIFDLEIPLPPLEEQKRIAGILDQADALRRLRARALEKLNTLGQAVFQEMFGGQGSDWPEVPLTEFVADKDDIKCGPFGTQLLKSEFQTEGVPLWGIKQVNKTFSIPTHEHVNEQKFKELKSYSLEARDIVMTRKGTVGNCAVYPDHFGVGIMHSDLLRVRVDRKRHNPIFLADQFHYSQNLSHQIDLISGGAIMAGINVGKLKALKAVAPPLEVQNDYARKIETIRSEAKRQTASQSSCESLFASLQSAAFQGRL